MKKSKIKILVFWLILILVLIGYDIGLKNRIERIKQHYQIVTCKDSINGVINNIKYIKIGKYLPGAAFVSISGTNYNILTMINSDRDQYFDKYINVGDSVIKFPNTDSIRIKRSQSEDDKVFILRQE